jgi:hypothetical protein
MEPAASSPPHEASSIFNAGLTSVRLSNSNVAEATSNVDPETTKVEETNEFKRRSCWEYFQRTLRKEYGLKCYRWERPASLREYLRENAEMLLCNLKSGGLLALFSIPLSLAIAAEATPTMGYVSAIWAGLTAAIFSGSSHTIVGPTGNLSALMPYYSLLFGAQVLSFISFLTGIMIFLAFVFRLDRYIELLPTSIVQGFTLGAAMIIVLNQLSYIVGLPPTNRHSQPASNVIDTLSRVEEWNIWAILFFLISLGALIFLTKKFPKGPWMAGLLLIGIPLGFGVDEGYFAGLGLITFNSVYLDTSIPIFAYHPFKMAYFTTGVFNAAFVLAFVCIFETLTVAKTAHQLTTVPFNQPLEILSASLGHLVGGLFGGLPTTSMFQHILLYLMNISTQIFHFLFNLILNLNLNFNFNLFPFLQRCFGTNHIEHILWCNFKVFCDCKFLGCFSDRVVFISFASVRFLFLDIYISSFQALCFNHFEWY